MYRVPLEHSFGSCSLWEWANENVRRQGIRKRVILRRVTEKMLFMFVLNHERMVGILTAKVEDTKINIKRYLKKQFEH